MSRHTLSAASFIEAQENVMPTIRSTLIAALALAPSAALAQMVIEEPPMMADEIIVVPGEPVPEAPIIAAPMTGPLVAEDAVAIAMMNGFVTVEDVDQRMWDGNFEVEGADAGGQDLEITIDAETGAVLDIDD
jgi:hypothetical protein